MPSLDPFDDAFPASDPPTPPPHSHPSSLVAPGEELRTTLARLLSALIAAYGTEAGEPMDRLLATLALSLTRYLHQPYPLRLTVIGPTGSGKSRLLNLLARTLGIPSVVVPLVDISETGWRGAQIGEVCRMLHPALFRADDGSQLLIPTRQRIERPSILLLDEVDKCALLHEGIRFSDTAAAARLGRQQSLLPVLDVESDMLVNYDRAGASFRYSLRQSIVICAGAFSMLPPDQPVTPSALVSVGLMQELVDRMGTIITLPVPSSAVRVSLAREVLDGITAFAQHLDVQVTGSDTFLRTLPPPGSDAPYIGLRGLQNFVTQRMTTALAMAMIAQRTTIDLAELAEEA